MHSGHIQTEVRAIKEKRGGGEHHSHTNRFFKIEVFGGKCSLPVIPCFICVFLLFSLQLVQGQNEEIAFCTGTLLMQASCVQKEMFVMPYDNKSFIDPACSVKMAGY